MSRFMSERSDAYEDAVEALTRLLEQEGPDGVERAAAEVLAPIREKRFCEWREVERYRDLPTTCVAGLFGKKHRDPFCEHCGPPACDHTDLFVKDGETVVFVTQPYRLAWEAMQKLVDYCRRFGLRADVSAQESWHFPGRTLVIGLARPEAREHVGW